MSRTFIYFLIFRVSALLLGEQIEILNIGQIDRGCWYIKYISPKSNIIAENYWIHVDIYECEIEESAPMPENEYLVLRSGNEDNEMEDVKVFTYMKDPTYLLHSDSLIVEIKIRPTWNKDCRICFAKVPKQTTPLPKTTTEITPTENPSVSKYSTTVKLGVSEYSTILISGKNYTSREILVMKIKENLAQMAENYTETEGFCLENGATIQTSDVKINLIEQCPKDWPNSEDCLRIGYALPIKINESYSLWKGYQLTGQHLDRMWSRMAREYLDDDLKVYKEPDVYSAVTWWIIGIVLTLLVLVGATIASSFAWTRRQIMKGSTGSLNKYY